MTTTNNNSSRLLDVRGASRIFGEGVHAVHALRNADLHADSGEMVAITGASGSGKSTLLTISGGLDRPSSGEVIVDGMDLASVSRVDLAHVRRRSIGYVFQELNLLSGLTAVENVAAPLELDGVKTTAALDEATARLVAVGLPDKLKSFPDDLSGGERQRVAIARALIGDRRLILADEPTGALDSTTGQSIMELLNAVCADGAAVVVVTHDRDIAAQADRMVRIHDGVTEEASA